MSAKESVLGQHIDVNASYKTKEFVGHEKKPGEIGRIEEDIPSFLFSTNLVGELLTEGCHHVGTKGAPDT